MTFTTYRDLIDHLTLYLGSGVNETTQEAARRSIQQAYGEMARSHNWSYFYDQGRFVTVAPYETGTVVYDASGGAYAKMLTLTGGVWPAWAASGSILVNGTIYQVDQRISDTVITLTNSQGDDIASTAYQLYQDTYTLPELFLKLDRPLHREGGFWMQEVHPTTWLNFQNMSRQFGQPSRYTITADPQSRSRMAIRLDPAPSAAHVFDYWMVRRGRPLLIDNYSDGLVTVASVTVTGQGTAFTSRMVGSVIRFSIDAINTPTANSGVNPAVAEAVVKSVDSVSQITLDGPITNITSGVKYIISDPLDVEAGAMETYMLRECEKQIRLMKSMNSTPEQLGAYDDAKLQAKQADDRSIERRQVGQHPHALSWKYLPIRDRS